MSIMNKFLSLTFSLIYIFSHAQQHKEFVYHPSSYVCQWTIDPIEIDGKINEINWKKAPWTESFVDIEGNIKPKPYYRTRAKMLWDEQYFYIAAELMEENLWATYDQRDAVIFHENDFEVFIDPDGDTHNYYELEINALGTVWDLLLTKPYRDDGNFAINAWDIAGLKKGIHLEGTLNNPKDKDIKWTIELAFPWKILKEAAPRNQKPQNGDIWNLNFSRVQWELEVSENHYVKKSDPQTNKPFSEHNWVWSPQGIIAMHQPETWGLVQFSTIPINEKIIPFSPNNDDHIKWTLRQVYYAQHKFKKENGTFATSLNQLALKTSNEFKKIKLYTSPNGFEVIYKKNNFLWIIQTDGRVFTKKNNK